MRALIFTCFALSYCSHSLSQKTYVNVKAGNNIMDVLSTTDVFYYPHFTAGRVFFRNGSATEAKLNYNRLFDEMHFINTNGDTLALAEEMNIKQVVIDKDTFYYDDGYLKLLSSGALAKLAIKEIWTIAEGRQLGAFNTTNNSVSITSFKSYNEGGRLYDLTVNEDLVLKKVAAFYFGDNNNHFVLATRKSLFLLFPREQPSIENYLKENKTDFNKKDDLEKIVKFLQHT